MLSRSHLKVADMLEDTKDDLLFPFQHLRQIWSTNPLERVNVLIEQHEEWDGADRRYFSEHSMALLLAETEEVSIPELTAA